MLFPWGGEVLKVEGEQKAMWEESWEPVWALRGSSMEVFKSPAPEALVP